MSGEHEHEWAFIREGKNGKMGRVCGICGHVEMRPERWGADAPGPTRHRRPYLRVTANGEVTVYPLPLVDVAIDAVTIAIMDCVSFGEDVTLAIERVSLWDDEAAEHLVSVSSDLTA